MIILTCRKWFGPSVRAQTAKQDLQIPIEEELIAYASELPVNQALFKLKEYEQLFESHGAGLCAVNHFVLGIQEHPGLSKDALDAGRISIIEEMVDSF